MGPVPSRRAGGRGHGSSGLRDERSAAVLEAILEPYHGQLLILPGSCAVFDAADGRARATC